VPFPGSKTVKLACSERLDAIAQILADSALEVSLLICPGEGFAIPVDTVERRALKWAHAKKALEIGARVGGVVDILPEYQAQTPLPLSEPPQAAQPGKAKRLSSPLSNSPTSPTLGTVRWCLPFSPA
jgi:hypothetical protein